MLQSPKSSGEIEAAAAAATGGSQLAALVSMPTDEVTLLLKITTEREREQELLEQREGLKQLLGSRHTRPKPPPTKPTSEESELEAELADVNEDIALATESLRRLSCIGSASWERSPSREPIYRADAVAAKEESLQRQHDAVERALESETMQYTIAVQQLDRMREELKSENAVVAQLKAEIQELEDNDAQLVTEDTRQLNLLESQAVDLRQQTQQLEALLDSVLRVAASDAQLCYSVFV